MKRLTCKQIGGVCDTILEAETPEEMTKVAAEHIAEKAKTDPAHKQSSKEMVRIIRRIFHDHFSGRMQGERIVIA